MRGGKDPAQSHTPDSRCCLVEHDETRLKRYVELGNGAGKSPLSRALRGAILAHEFPELIDCADSRISDLVSKPADEGRIIQGLSAKRGFRHPGM